MKSISIDFKNHMLCIMKDGQHGTQLAPDFKKEEFYSFIPEKYRDGTSFTWNFENETFAVNQDYQLQDGSIMTEDCFIPHLIMPMKGLKKRYDKFIATLGLEEVDLKAEMPEELRKLLGLE